MSKRFTHEIEVDEILLDSSNLPAFDQSQFEGRIEKAISKNSIIAIGIFFVIVGLLYGARLANLQLNRGESYVSRSSDNTLSQVTIKPSRGVIYDRHGELLAWNAPGRSYTDKKGLAHVVGYVGYPDAEEFSAGIVPDAEIMIGKVGAEWTMQDTLGGVVGLKIEERDVTGDVLSESLQTLPEDGKDVILAIDSELSEAMYEAIRAVALRRGFTGGAGVILDSSTGEIISMVSYPEFSLKDFETGSEGRESTDQINAEGTPYLNRAISGLYTPGSIVKPFIGLAALTEGVITPEKEILSTGSISIPHPYIPDSFTVFNDWKAHGWVDMSYAIAFSSNVYFFEIGGGFEEQKGLGIDKIADYLRSFGFGEETGVSLTGEVSGLVPTPQWKEDTFAGEPWRLGDTYNTSIGQYGFQVTPMQAARAVTALVNNGDMVTPKLEKGGSVRKERVGKGIKPEQYEVVKNAMRLATTHGTAAALNIPGVEIAAKTGTAEIGITKKLVNSWVVGYFPYDEPKYVFALVMERGPRSNLVGASSVMRDFVLWMQENSPWYLDPTIKPEKISQAENQP